MRHILVNTQQRYHACDAAELFQMNEGGKDAPAHGAVMARGAGLAPHIFAFCPYLDCQRTESASNLRVVCSSSTIPSSCLGLFKPRGS